MTGPSRVETRPTSVYRPGWIVPLTIVLGVVAIAYIATSPHRFADAWVFLFLFAIFALPVMIRLRRAVILTPTALRYRQVCGQILEVPFSGIKRVSLIEPEQDGEVQTLQIELLVSGELRVPLDVRYSEEVAERVRAAVQAYKR